MKRLSLPTLLVLCWSAVCGAAYDVEAIRADAKFFTEARCSQLKAGVSAQDLASFKSDLLKSVAAALLEGTYDTTCRTARYEAYPSPSELGRTLKLGDGFSRYENITVNDYRKYRYTITQQTVDQTKAYIAAKQYQKPAVDIALIEDER